MNGLEELSPFVTLERESRYGGNVKASRSAIFEVTAADAHLWETRRPRVVDPGGEEFAGQL